MRILSFILAIIVAALAAALFVISQRPEVSTQEIDRDRASVTGQISEAETEASKYSSGAVKTFLDLRLAVLRASSSTLLSIIDPLMRNMTDLWVRLLSTEAFNPRAPEIADVVTLIRSLILQGQMLHPTYKSSYFKVHTRAFGPQDKIICWRDDWKDAPVEVIQLSSVAPLHPSWRQPEPTMKV